MAQNPAVLYRGRPTVSGTVYTVAAGKTVIVKQIVLNNSSTTGGQIVDVSIGGQTISYTPLAAQSVTILDLSQVLNAGDTVVVSVANANGYVAVHISGVVSP